MNTPKLGQTVHDKRDASSTTWKVVGFSADGFVQLTGPGPCRSMKAVTVVELDEWWEAVE